MSQRAQDAYRHASAAFKNPMLDLLHGRYAPFVVTILSLVFTPDRPTISVADAHVEIGEALDELRSAGFDDDPDTSGLPAGSAREICRYWVRVGWLVPQLDGDVEVYRLSAHAVGALEIAGRAGGTGTKVSTSRVRTLLGAIDRLRDDAETDPAARIAALQAQRDELDAQITEIGQRGVPPTDQETLLEEAENVVHLARELPADFSRVAESIKAMQRDVVAALRQDIRPTGDVLREYLERGQHVMESTPEGRAFAGALRLIGDPERIDRLSNDLYDLLTRPFARAMDHTQRGELAAIGRRVEQGVQEVLDAQRRASHVITNQVRTHDPIRDRQVDDLLRDVMAGMQAWMQVSGPGQRVAPVVGFPTAELGHLRRTIADLRPPAGPAPLTDGEAAAVFAPDDTRAWGGPHYRELEDFVDSLPGETFDLATAFDGAPASDRRPVDLLGLLEIAHGLGFVDDDQQVDDQPNVQDVSVVQTVRPDGSTRRFAFAAISATTPAAAQESSTSTEEAAETRKPAEQEADD